MPVDLNMVNWDRDPAASGWRSRAFLDKGHITVYDDGEWDVVIRPNYQPSAHGKESDAELGKAKAIAVYNALISG